MAIPSNFDQLNLDELWQEQPGLIRTFLDRRTDYIRLAGEVEYVLSHTLTTQQVVTATISSRAKGLESFLEKIQRKQYEEPFAQMTDLAGVRVVCLYRDDVETVEQVVRDTFDVVDYVDRRAGLGLDRFGYTAAHFIVKLSAAMTGARYDELREFPCEIQVRTVLQDAWAIIDHHLAYKRGAEIPDEIRRRLNAIAGALELADSEFTSIKDARNTYVESIRELQATPSLFLNSPVNLDSLEAYAKWKFPTLPLESTPGQLSRLSNALDLDSYSTLQSLDTVVNGTNDQREALVDAVASDVEYDPSAVNEIAMSLFLTDDKFRSSGRIPQAWFQAPNPR